MVIVMPTRSNLRDGFAMVDEVFALSPISARAAQPNEADYEAIRDAFMETSRGRWFLGEYAKRNRNADTSMVLDAVMLRTNPFARMAVCGMIAGYDGQPLPMANPALILINRLRVEGFIVSEHMEVWPEALAELAELVGSGRFRPRETVAHGIESAPEAFLGLLKGRNFGKQLVKLV